MAAQANRFARVLVGLGVLAALCAQACAQERPKVPASFAPLIASLWPEAQARGITRKTFDLAFTGLTPDPRVAALTMRQLEYGVPVATYLARIASPARIEGAARKARDWKPTLDAIEKQYGVDRWIILALWGIETSSGANNGGFDVIRSLATLVAMEYRADYFRDELVAALQVLQQGHIAREKMIGSWAGAMGQPQFMPSNFLTLAVDFTRDGRKDIWASAPDVLASIANFLKHWGWKAGEEWGCEVIVPHGFDYRRSRASYAEWAALGLKRADGKAMPHGNAILFFPSGASGPAFLVGENFEVIKRYNISDVFALAATQIADRAQGRAGVRAAWPAHDPQLTRAERIALQKRMNELGHPVNDFEGRIDFDLRDEIRLEQVKHSMVPDGHPTRELMERIGAR
jgi:membrane-bound lytic murein transglycosylase B